MSQKEYEALKQEALKLYDAAHIVLTEKEKENMEITGFGLGQTRISGLIIVTYVNTEKCCAKEMVLLPGQTCPEHRHAPVAGTNYTGKEETFRCRYGEVYLYVEGEKTPNPKAAVPAGSEAWYTVWHEVILHPGEQYTIYPDTRHWFQGGKDGAVVSEFSTASHDEYDIFTDPHIDRLA